MGNNSGFEVDLHALDTMAKELDSASDAMTAVPGEVNGATLPELNTTGEFTKFRSGYQAFQSALGEFAKAAANAATEAASGVLKTRQYFEQAESENTKNLGNADKGK
jgi:hypothetical protein